MWGAYVAMCAYYMYDCDRDLGVVADPCKCPVVESLLKAWWLMRNRREQSWMYGQNISSHRSCLSSFSNKVQDLWIIFVVIYMHVFTKLWIRMFCYPTCIHMYLYSTECCPFSPPQKKKSFSLSHSQFCRNYVMLSKWAKFSFHSLVDCIHFKATFHNRPHYWSISSNMDSWKFAKTRGNKEITCFIWLHLKISIFEFRLILLAPITCNLINLKFWRLNYVLRNCLIIKLCQDLFKVDLRFLGRSVK